MSWTARASRPASRPAMVEEHVDQLPEQVVEGLDQLLGHERVVAGRLELTLGPRGAEGDRQAAAPPRQRERGTGLGVTVGLEADHDVVGLGHGLDLRGELAALGREPERRQRPLADDHRVHELDRDVAGVRARRRRAPQGDQPSAAGEALRHPVTAAGQPLGLGLEEALAGRDPRAQQLVDAGGEVLLGRRSDRRLLPGARRPPSRGRAPRRATRATRRRPRRCGRWP